ncbi:hypothetical protein QCD79_31290, partial [Pseudomonas quasicaspiana]|nr:hypothetical protein [Pseudomonas quasicaspiana]
MHRQWRRSVFAFGKGLNDAFFMKDFCQPGSGAPDPGWQKSFIKKASFNPLPKAKTERRHCRCIGPSLARCY